MFKWEEQHVCVTPPAKPKKCTGTRFASILGYNAWNTPFSAWCEITRTYEKPFEDTKYTSAGKSIEPIQLAYCRDIYFMRIHTPTDEYGENYFKKTFGDFYPNDPIFGGMWDALVLGADGKPVRVIECKTTKRAEDWQGGKIPEYYALQAALYAYLLGVDDVTMVASFLTESDYDHPENYKCSVNNTILVPFKVSERYPKFKQLITAVQKWWKAYVETGISPDYDEKLDADLLKALRTNNIDTSLTGTADIVAEIEVLTAEIDAHEELITDKQKRLKTLKSALSEQMKKAFAPGDKATVITGKNYIFTCTKTITEKINTDALKTDGLYDKYKKSEEGYRLTIKEINNGNG